MKDPENLYIKRAMTLIELSRQEEDNRQQYLWEAQVYATVAQAVELEQVREILDRMESQLSRMDSSLSEASTSLNFTADILHTWSGQQ